MEQIITKPKTEEETAHNTALLRSLRSPQQLASLLGLDMLKMPLLALPDQYTSFKIPKPNGKFRLIEAPNKPLKNVQQQLNTLLQSLYNSFRPSCSFGFIYNTDDTAPDKRRDIVSHAKTHLGKDWMLNIDLKDFFHYISESNVTAILSAGPCNLNPHVAAHIAKLSCIHGRLPMGAPTSPVLSNLCLYAFDMETSAWAAEKTFLYTRFADDITLSSDKRIRVHHYVYLQEKLSELGLQMNTKKFRLYEPGTPREVTGIRIGKKKIKVSPAFLEEVRKDIAYYKSVRRFQTHYETVFSNPQQPSASLKFARRSIEGKLNFIGYVQGWKNLIYIEMMRQYKQSKRNIPGITNSGYYYFLKPAV